MSLLRSIDIGRLILAFVLALGLWIVVQTEQNPERTSLTDFEITVDVVDIGDNLAMVSEPPRVQLWVRAPENVLPRLRENNFSARVDAAGVGVGAHEMPVEVEAYDPLVRLAEPRPDRVRVRVEEVRERTVPVRINPTGPVPFGYAVGTGQPTPDRVTVTGAESLVQRVDAVVVDVPMAGVTVSMTGNFAPRAVDARGTELRTLSIQPAQVSVEVPVHQEVTYKEVGIRPTMAGTLPSGYYLLPIDVDPPSATVVGHPDVVSAINVLDTEPVDVTDVASSVVRRARVDVPPGVSLLQPDLNVLVTVRVETMEVTQAMRLLPTVEGLGSELMVSNDLPVVEFSVSGPAPTLQALGPRDFRISLDLEGLGPGRHQVEPRVELPATFTLEQMEPSRVLVEITEAPSPEARANAAS